MSLGPITAVTVSTPDLVASENAYARHLGYRVTTRGRLSGDLARSWRSPESEGSRYAVLRPEAADDFEFRFVESPIAAGYRAFSSFGWNAAELIVRDVDALATTLQGTAFEMLGPPQDLSFTDAIRAMQVRGPAGEILYLTQFKRPLPALPAPPARCAADRVFIVIVGGPSLDELLSFYARTFGMAEPQRMESRVKAISENFGLSPEHRYQIAAVPLDGHCYIEADEMPSAAGRAPAANGTLPPGIAMVSFRSPLPRGCLTGAVGELIELVDR